MTIPTISGPTPPTVLAIAYSNLDGVDGYQDGGSDVWIARVVDTNTDGQVSIGDTIETNKYPQDYAASSFGDFQVTSHTVTWVVNATSERLNLRTNNSDFWKFWFVHDQVEELYYERVEPQSPTQLKDRFDSAFESRQVVTSSPSQPSSGEGASPRSSPGDDLFIDVDIFI